jgi:hypothetical protein
MCRVSHHILGHLNIYTVQEKTDAKNTEAWLQYKGEEEGLGSESLGRRRKVFCFRSTEQ